MIDVLKHDWRSEVFHFSFADVTVVTGMDKLVPSADSNFSDIILHY